MNIITKSMNIITKSDTKKFIALLKAGLKNGKLKELRSHSSATNHEGLDVVKSYYISLEFRCRLLPEDIDDILTEDLMDNEIDELLS